jgi:hypothetical protein
MGERTYNKKMIFRDWGIGSSAYRIVCGWKNKKSPQRREGFSILIR